MCIYRYTHTHICKYVNACVGVCVSLRGRKMKILSVNSQFSNNGRSITVF